MFTKMPDKQDFYRDVIEGVGAGIDGVYTREEYLKVLDKHFKSVKSKYVHRVEFNSAAYENAVKEFLSKIENPLLRIRTQILLDDYSRDSRKFQLFEYIFNLEALLEKLTNLQVKNAPWSYSWGRILTNSPEEVLKFFADLERRGGFCHIKDFDGTVHCTYGFNFETASFVDWARKKKILLVFIVANCFL